MVPLLRGFLPSTSWVFRMGFYVSLFHPFQKHGISCSFCGTIFLCRISRVPFVLLLCSRSNGMLCPSPGIAEQLYCAFLASPFSVAEVNLCFFPSCSAGGTLLSALASLSPVPCGNLPVLSLNFPLGWLYLGCLKGLMKSMWSICCPIAGICCQGDAT